MREVLKLLECRLNCYRRAQYWRTSMAFTLLWTLCWLLSRSAILGQHTRSTKNSEFRLVSGYYREIVVLELRDNQAAAISRGAKISSHDSLVQVEKWPRIFTIAIHAIVLVQTECVFWVGAETCDVGRNLQISSWLYEDSIAGCAGCKIKLFSKSDCSIASETALCHKSLLFNADTVASAWPF